MLALGSKLNWLTSSDYFLYICFNKWLHFYTFVMNWAMPQCIEGYIVAIRILSMILPDYSPILHVLLLINSLLSRLGQLERNIGLPAGVSPHRVIHNQVDVSFLDY